MSKLKRLLEVSKKINMDQIRLIYRQDEKKRAEETKLDFRCTIFGSAIDQASCLICSRSRQLTFPFCC